MKPVLITLVALSGTVVAFANQASRIADVRAEFERANVQYRAQHYDSAGTTYLDAAKHAADLPADSVWTILRDGNYNAACCAALLGKGSDAFVLLHSAVANGFWDMNFISLDKDLKTLHDDALYDSLAVHIRHVKDSMTRVVGNAAPLVRFPKDTAHLRDAPVVIALHGANSTPSAALAYWDRIADSAGCIILAPFGTHVKSPRELSFGLNADSADHIVHASIRFIEARTGSSNHRVIIAGTGLGGAVAFQIGMKHPEIFHGTISVNGFYNSAFCNRFIPEVRRLGACIFGVYDASSAYVAGSNLRAEDTLRGSGINVLVRSTSHSELLPGNADIVKAVHWMLDE